MKKLETHSRVVPWVMASILSLLAAGCGGGGGGQDPILGFGNGIATVAPAVTAVSPAPGAIGVSINTKMVTAAFNKAMDATTITKSSFTLACPGTAPISDAVVTYSGIGNLATLTLPATMSLPASTTCTGTVTTAVKDTFGIALAANFTWLFTTGLVPDTTAPTVTGTNIANGAVDVSTNTSVGATFSEVMNAATVNSDSFTLKQGATSIAGSVSYIGVSAVFMPNSALALNTTYTATIKGGAAAGVKDVAGNAMVTDFVWTWTTSAGRDTTTPSVTGTINANGATNVAFNTKVGATFTEAMDPLKMTNANITLKDAASGVAVPGTVSYSGVSVVFTPLVNLTPSTRYTATIKGAPDGVSDLAGNRMLSDYIWSWTTGVAPDTTPPTVTGTIHTNGQTNVAFNTKVGATFSEAMDPLTITNTNFLLKESVSGAAVAGTINYSGVNAVFVPTTNLAPSTNYTVTVKAGAAGVKDLAGNAMVSDFVISWSTGAAPDTTAPTVTLVNPADLATDVPVTTSVSATFSEPMDALTMSTANFSVVGTTSVTGLVTFDAASRIVTFKPSTNLADSTTYTATVSTGAKDLAGNALASDKVWRFTTAAGIVIPPVVTPINLGSASTYGSFGGTAGMTNMGTLTLINGNIGTTATGTTAITGYHDTGGDIYTETGSNKASVNGLIHTCTTSTVGPTSASVSAPKCALATQARLDAQTAYLFLAAKPPGANPGANLAGKTLAPGVYTSPSGSFLIEGGDLTLDAQGDANAQFIFQMATTLTVGGPGAAFPQSIVLAGGAQAKNVFWQVGSFATINAGGGGTMVGTIISQAGVSISTAGNVSIVTLNGRAMSLGASVTLVNTVINVP